MMQYAIPLLLLLALSACNQVDKQPNSTSDTVHVLTSAPLTTHSYYTGVIQPIKTTVVTSPAEGIVDDIQFHYGEAVDAKQLLFTIASEKFQTDYKNAMMQYIKAKTDFNNQQSQLSEAKFLRKNELISDDDFKAKQTNFYTSQLTLVQAEDVLATFVKQLNIKGFNPYALTIADIDKITQALKNDAHSQKIPIFSPAEGLALLPIKNDNDGQLKKVTKGESVKQGEVLAMIGNVSGLSVSIHVNEFNVNQIKVQQKVKVTGTAFPQFVLAGEIASIDRQGQTSSAGQPIFPVNIIVPTLTKEERAVIHMGMTAKVEIQMETEPKFTVPLSAILEKNNVNYVKVEKNKHIIDIPVKTGETTPTAVVIAGNLKTGDHIVLAH